MVEMCYNESYIGRKFGEGKREMSDYYTEQLVEKKSSAADWMIKIGMILLTVLSVVVVFFFPFGIILPVLAIILDVFLFRRMNVEYEYLYVNGELDIDIILNKAKRKRKFSAEINDVELLAPIGAPELEKYQNVKAKDFSSGNKQARRYVLVVAKRGEVKKIIFEPNDTIIEGYFMLAPRKVVRS